MSKLGIIYWSGTGKTKKMAELIGQDVEADIISIEDVTEDLLSTYSNLALGCPSMGAEVLEESLMEPFIEDGNFEDKRLVLFGSYDWGDGEWMRDWEERMTQKGASVLDTLIVHLEPEGDSANECIELGRSFE